MKKFLLSLVFAFALFVLPTNVFANVDLTMKDTSTTGSTTKTATIAVNTGDDSLTEVALDIQTSEGMTISNVQTTENTCDSFSYTYANNVLNIKCTFNTATKLSENIATITFTTTSSDYTFTVLNNTNLSIGELTLGNITNIEATDTASNTDTTTSNTTTTASTNTTTKKDLKDQIMDYLPYVLIGGAAILLISILGIIFGKKAETTPVATQSTLEATPTVIPPTQEPVQATSSSINIDDISQNLYSPVESKPTIKETIEMNNDTIPMVNESAMQPEPTIKITEDSQGSDLQDLIQGEASATPMAPVTEDITEAPTEQTDTVAPIPTPVEVTPTQTTVDQLPTSDTPVVETPISVEEPPIPDLQQFINNQVAQVPSAPAVPETPATSTPTPTSGENASTPTTPTTF